MGSTAAFYVIVGMVTGGFAGWYARQARGVHADIKTYKARLPAFRRIRTRSGVISVTIIVLALLTLHALIG